MASCRAARKRERSRCEKGLGPPVTAPASRSSAIRLRVATAMPMPASVKARPFGAITLAPAFTQRPASGTSAVTTMSPGPTRSAIQSSAASKPAPTTTRLIQSSRGSAMMSLATTCTVSPCRSAIL